MVFLCVFALDAQASRRPIEKSQSDYERSISSIVRKKLFYKAGRIELTPKVGMMPYDSIIDHYAFGGSAVWHLSDHYGWEVIDVHLVQPSVTKFTTDLVSSKGLSNLQATKINLVASSNFVLSPLYGKIRFLGSAVIHLDIYLTIGLGVAQTKVLTVSAAGLNQVATTTDSASSFDPMLNVGFGFKFFVNRAMSVVFDLRDYITYSTVYGNKRVKSNFAVFGGLSFYLPTFD